jgi:hypothetical protein
MSERPTNRSARARAAAMARWQNRQPTIGPINRTITITLRPEPRVNGLAAVRAALKVLLRTFGLRCTGITIAETPDRGVVPAHQKD